MNKKEYVGAFGSKAETMATSKEFAALMLLARTENPHLHMLGTDPTSLIKTGGAAVGWNDCIKFLETAHRLEPEKPPKEHTPSYRDPENPQPRQKP